MSANSIHLMLRRRCFLLAGLVSFAGGSFGLGFGALAAEQATSANEHHEHHHHHAPVSSATVKRSEGAYTLPALKLVRQDGTKVDVVKEIDDGRPVILNFIYTSCTAICPVTSQVFSEVQEKLGKERGKVRMVSISIDPEYDTPSRLSAYAKQFGASAQWQFYSGTMEASIAVQKAFDAYRGDKMNHLPLTFLRSAPGKPWVRLDGFASPDEVIREFQSLSKGT